MGSKFIRSRESQNRPEGTKQVVEELISARILPIYGTKAFDDKKLPMEMERKFGNKFFEDGKLMSTGWLENETEFKIRVQTECNKYMRAHIKFKHKATHIQHLKV